MFDNCLSYEVVRDYEFAPIKNKSGCGLCGERKSTFTEKWCGIMIKECSV